MGNSIFASMFTRFTHAAMKDLVLLLLTGHDSCTSSLDLLLFLYGTRVSNSVANVEGTFPSSMTPLVSAISISSSIKVPPHSRQDSVVRIFVYPYVLIGPIALASTVTAYNATPVSNSAAGASTLSILSIGFDVVAASPFSSSCLIEFFF